MSESITAALDTQFPPDALTIRKRVVLVGGLLGVLVNLSALVVPVLNDIGGGIVAGLVAAYIIGGPRGWIHGILAGGIVGLFSGFTVMLTAGTIGLYIEPPTLMENVVGLINPLFNGLGGIGMVFTALGAAAFIVVDSIIGGLIGGLLRSLVDAAFRNGQ